MVIPDGRGLQDKRKLLAGPLDLVRQGGDCDVAAFLMQRDLSAFDAKAPPAKTPAFWEIVDAGAVPEDAELADALDTISDREGLGKDACGNHVWPKAITLDQAKRAGSQEFPDWAGDRKNRRSCRTVSRSAAIPDPQRRRH